MLARSSNCSHHQWPDRESGDRQRREIVDSAPESLVGEIAGQPSSSKNGDRLDIHEVRHRYSRGGCKPGAGDMSGSFVVTDHVGDDGRVDDDHRLARSSWRSSTAVCSPTRPPDRSAIRGRPRRWSAIARRARVRSSDAAAATGLRLRRDAEGSRGLGGKVSNQHVRHACIELASGRVRKSTRAMIASRGTGRPECGLHVVSQHHGSVSGHRKLPTDGQRMLRQSQRSSWWPRGRPAS